ncbi:conserved hypothetical protein [uncultured Desulfatiglans sp.]|uniref:Uncharacterized protein n=1 Tax=Uncultured Desulfatiglans sp. TaxID=1748965 RepID=A0A653A3Q2_UNCDX|nr:conserved hypothetical protein [uncultured Desulfatiglans sp.]
MVSPLERKIIFFSSIRKNRFRSETREEQDPMAKHKKIERKREIERRRRRREKRLKARAREERLARGGQAQA